MQPDSLIDSIMAEISLDSKEFDDTLYLMTHSIVCIK